MLGCAGVICGRLPARFDVMKVVIQCCATKEKYAGTFTLNGQRIEFVAHPELCREAAHEILARPDDKIPPTPITWREHLLEYNQRRDNPNRLLRAVNLYSPEIYRRLVKYVGIENLFILSAGWGLIRADFLLPNYDITFSSQAEAWKRRDKRDVFADFAQLTHADLSDAEDVYFFGGKDYLPLYYRLTRTLSAKKVIYYVSGNIPKDQEYRYIPYRSAGTNWHYRCANDFVNGEIER